MDGTRAADSARALLESAVKSFPEVLAIGLALTHVRGHAIADREGGQAWPARAISSRRSQPSPPSKTGHSFWVADSFASRVPRPPSWKTDAQQDAANALGAGVLGMAMQAVLFSASYGAPLARLWLVNHDLVVQAMADAHRMEPSVASRFLDMATELKVRHRTSAGTCTRLAALTVPAAGASPSSATLRLHLTPAAPRWGSCTRSYRPSSTASRRRFRLRSTWRRWRRGATT